jgi:hypothetical protein
MASESNPLDRELAAVERRLMQWNPASGRLDRDRVLFESGKASAQPRAGRGSWVVLSIVMTGAALVFGSLFVQERGQRRTLAKALRESGKVGAIVTREPVKVFPLDAPAARSSENEYLPLRNRVLARGLDAWTIAEAQDTDAPPRETPRILLTPTGALRVLSPDPTDSL